MGLTGHGGSRTPVRMRQSLRHSQRGINEQAGVFSTDVRAGRQSIRRFTPTGGEGALLEPGFGRYDYEIPNTAGGEGNTVGFINEDPGYQQRYDTQIGREGELDAYNALPKRGVKAQLNAKGIGDIAGGAGAAWEAAQKSEKAAGAYGFGPRTFGRQRGGR